ncbi:tail fiber domain-containing protein [Pedobacter sp. JY14-1]|uniref:tail fiber domain-containing protein n=1 Tax=Pedobacter sp. JY14-1 TaxID=3034151 RepID=UPI0023E2732C|nr:tail fiber domain-containing protein [Pedobacter sp. JY14-1]
MKYPILGKSAVLGLFLSACVFTVNAQNIEESELKVNVEKVSGSARQLINLEPVKFQYDVKKYKGLNLPSGNQYGFLASNVQSSFPELVHETARQYPSGKNSNKVVTYKEVDNKDLIPVLVAAIKEQQSEIEMLKKEIGLLKKQAR